MWSEVSRLSLAPSPHYSLFVTSIFILVHTYTIESLIRGQIQPFYILVNPQSDANVAAHKTFLFSGNKLLKQCKFGALHESAAMCLAQALQVLKVMGIDAFTLTPLPQN